MNLLKQIQGNAKGCVMFEPMFILPYSMLSTYASVYMLDMGINETEIGVITSAGMIMQIFTAFISGHLTDSMGRRKALLVYDLLSWSVATLIWAISQNFWFFLLAALVNSFQRVPTTAWYCLLVEDTDQEKRSIVFTILQFVGVIGGLFAPLGGLLVEHFTVIPAMRIMYFIAFVSMTLMFFGRNHFTHETEIGKRKMQESAQIGFAENLREYLSVIRYIFANKPLMTIFGVYVLFNFQMTMRNTYLSVYLVDALQIKDSLISVFPAVSSVAMLFLLLFVIPRFKEKNAQRYMLAGFFISIAANLILILIGPGQLFWIIASTILAAAGSIVANPYLESVVANSIDDNNRAKIFSLLGVLILIGTFPTGVIGGWTYTIDPRIPMLLVVLSFVASIFLLFVFMNQIRRQESGSRQGNKPSLQSID